VGLDEDEVATRRGPGLILVGLVARQAVDAASRACASRDI
jgi:hypothetical protein